MTGLMWECQVTSGRRPGVFIFCMCVVGSFLVFFSSSLLFSVPKFCSCDLIYTKQSCKFAVLQFLPSSGTRMAIPATPGKGAGVFHMKADELTKSCLRCGKYWCTCYSTKPLLNMSQKAGNTLGVSESALLLSIKAGRPLFTAVPFWKHRGIICKMKKKL